jgi:hypothetical protein
MVERLERGAGDELRDEREHPGALVVGDVSAGDDDDEVGDRSATTATMISSARLPGLIRPVSTPITTSTTVPAAVGLGQVRLSR